MEGNVNCRMFKFGWDNCFLLFFICLFLIMKSKCSLAPLYLSLLLLLLLTFGSNISHQQIIFAVAYIFLFNFITVHAWQIILQYLFGYRYLRCTWWYASKTMESKFENYHVDEHSLVTKNWWFASNLACPPCDCSQQLVADYCLESQNTGSGYTTFFQLDALIGKYV